MSLPSNDVPIADERPQAENLFTIVHENTDTGEGIVTWEVSEPVMYETLERLFGVDKKEPNKSIVTVFDDRALAHLVQTQETFAPKAEKVSLSDRKNREKATDWPRTLFEGLYHDGEGTRYSFSSRTNASLRKFLKTNQNDRRIANDSGGPPGFIFWRFSSAQDPCAPPIVLAGLSTAVENGQHVNQGGNVNIKCFTRLRDLIPNQTRKYYMPVSEILTGAIDRLNRRTSTAGAGDTAKSPGWRKPEYIISTRTEDSGVKYRSFTNGAEVKDILTLSQQKALSATHKSTITLHAAHISPNLCESFDTAYTDLRHPDTGKDAQFQVKTHEVDGQGTDHWVSQDMTAAELSGSIHHLIDGTEDATTGRSLDWIKFEPILLAAESKKPVPSSTTARGQGDHPPAQSYAGSAGPLEDTSIARDLNDNTGQTSWSPDGGSSEQTTQATSRPDGRQPLQTEDMSGFAPESWEYQSGGASHTISAHAWQQHCENVTRAANAANSTPVVTEIKVSPWSVAPSTPAR